MSNLKQDFTKETTIIKHYIKDLSFENLQGINNQNFHKDDVKLFDNISAIFQNYNENDFSILLKYNCDCTLEKNNQKVFVLEIDYFGLFNINKKEDYTQDILTQSGVALLYPILKHVVEYITKNGAPFSISLNDLDFNLIKN